MKKYILSLLLVVVAQCVITVSAQNVVLKSLPDSLSYYIGDTEGGFTVLNAQKSADSLQQVEAAKRAMNYVFSLPDDDMLYIKSLTRAIEMRSILADMMRNGIAVNPQLYLDAFNAALTSTDRDEAKMNERRLTTHALLDRAANEINRMRQAEREKTLAKNKADGAEFIAKAKKADKKIKTSESGLSYKCIKAGKGVAPKASDSVKVHYTGRLTDGKVFDSSVERGQPATFGVDKLIKGFTEGLLMMKPGAKYTFYIPSDLGYGDGGNEAIAPGSTLIFDVELLEVNPEK